MAMRHYGGSVPSAGPLEWSCPACAHVNHVPLKAGCQACGAKDGAGARKVELPVVGPQTAGPAPRSGLAPETHALIAEEAREDAQRVVKFTLTTQARAAYEQWVSAHTWVGEIDPEQLQEAFMAGVAWAQGQTYDKAVAPARAALDGLTEKGFQVHADRLVTSPVTGQEYLFLTEQQEVPAKTVDSPTLQTILAALAFYRDNQLAYGVVPGQLSAEQVTGLLARLSPQESEGEA